MPAHHSGGGAMALKVSKAEVWAVTIDDRPGGAAEKLEGLSKAGANLEMLLARRSEPGKGVMFVTPVKGKKAVEAAQQAGMGRPENIHSDRKSTRLNSSHSQTSYAVFCLKK